MNKILVVAITIISIVIITLIVLISLAVTYNVRNASDLSRLLNEDIQDNSIVVYNPDPANFTIDGQITSLSHHKWSLQGTGYSSCNDVEYLLTNPLIETNPFNRDASSINLPVLMASVVKPSTTGKIYDYIISRDQFTSPLLNQFKLLDHNWITITQSSKITTYAIIIGVVNPSWVIAKPSDVSQCTLVVAKCPNNDCTNILLNTNIQPNKFSVIVLPNGQYYKLRCSSNCGDKYDSCLATNSDYNTCSNQHNDCYSKYRSLSARFYLYSELINCTQK
jgi:hypothetical protein